ncbi:hypothetical protein GCM10028805_46130 [Spirosoma harenae]
MSTLYPLMTLERLPEFMEPQEVREMIAFLMCNAVRSKEFHALKRLEQTNIVEFCLSVQNILLGAFNEQVE